MALAYVIILKNKDGTRELHTNAHGVAVYSTKSGAEKKAAKQCEYYEGLLNKSSIKYSESRIEFFKKQLAKYKNAEIVAIE